MSLVRDTETTDTAYDPSGVELISAVATLNYGEDFRLISDTPTEIVAENMTAPVDAPEIVRVSQRKIANIYQGTDIDPALSLPVRTGTATLFELRDTIVVSDDEDATYRRLVPLKCGFVLTIPTECTAAEVFTLFARAVSLLFPSGGVGTQTEILNQMLHGALRRADLV